MLDAMHKNNKTKTFIFVNMWAMLLLPIFDLMQRVTHFSREAAFYFFDSGAIYLKIFCHEFTFFVGLCNPKPYNISINHSHFRTEASQ